MPTVHGLHIFSGADEVEKSVGITKNTWADAIMALDEDEPALDCLRTLVQPLIPTQLTHGLLPPQIENMESFVCLVNCNSGPHKLQEMRWEMLRSRNFEGEKPTANTRSHSSPYYECKLHSLA